MARDKTQSPLLASFVISVQTRGLVQSLQLKTNWKDIFSLNDWNKAHYKIMVSKSWHITLFPSQSSPATVERSLDLITDNSLKIIRRYVNSRLYTHVTFLFPAPFHHRLQCLYSWMVLSSAQVELSTFFCKDGKMEYSPGLKNVFP